MRRNFLVALIVCLIPTAIAGFYVARGFVRESHGETGFRRGIDLAGGTILVYEVKTPEGKESSLTSEDIKKLAENLKRRIDPADLRNVVVRPVGASRVEIILPFAGSTGGGKEGANEDFVREVRALVGQAGVLEFRIVANPTDDREAIGDARTLLARADADPKFKAELDERARKGLPPPAPDKTYTVTVNNNTQDDVRYEWIELGREERDTYGLSNAYATEAPKTRRSGEQGTWLYPVLAAARGKTYEYGQMLLYSRDHIETVKAKDEENKKVEYFVLTRVSKADSFRVAGDIKLTAHVDTRNLNPAVGFNFNAAGANQFGKITERNRKDSSGFKRQLAVILDKKIVSAPTLDAVIRDSGQISGESFDLGGVTRLVYILRSGALNAELKPDPVSENTVGPTLGQDTIRKGTMAVGVAFGVVLVFMVLYYRFAGFVACVALLANLLLTIGFMVMVNAAFTLPGLAGIVLMLGMAVDANVLIYERLREERNKGSNLATAIRLGYDRAFLTIIDTHLTSIFTAIVLYTFGNDNLKGFAVSLTVGLIISLFTSLYVTRLMFDFWLHKRWLTALKMHQLLSRQNINFMRLRNVMFLITGGLTVLGLGLFMARGEGVLNVDFTKGTAYGGRLKEGRALNDSDGKAGLLTLLGEDRQAERLKVAEVVPLTGGEAEGDATDTARSRGEYIYKIKYADGTDATVTFVNPPDGADQKAQQADVTQRAQQLPGLSVEQVFISGQDNDLPFGVSRSFTVRTTEKEPDLVRVSLDRLLRDERTNEQLLAVTHVTDVKVTGPVAVLTLDRPTSPGELRAFVLRELRLAGRVPAVGSAVPVEVTGVAAADPAVAAEEGRNGKYTAIKVDVSGNPEFKPLRDATEAKKDVATDKRAADDLAAFKRVLDASKAAFEARPIPDRLETFDPALAASTRNSALGAIAISWMAILAYLWFRFGNWTFGLAAVLCLLHDLCFTLGAIAVCHYLHMIPGASLLGVQDFKIDLAAVAALLTLVGYSVNEIIVNFARIREVRGKNPLLTPEMINDSVNQTLSRTILTSMTVFLVSFVLYAFGGEGVHLFAFVMVTGVMISTYSSIFVASPLLLIFGEGKPRAGDRAAAAPVAEAKPSETVS